MGALMTTTIEGQPTSAEVRASLAGEGRPVLLAFSRGKDSIAAWLALRDAGVDVVPFSEPPASYRPWAAS
jgi:predicted PP-loop superfamily ATPase